MTESLETLLRNLLAGLGLTATAQSARDWQLPVYNGVDYRFTVAGKIPDDLAAVSFKLAFKVSGWVLVAMTKVGADQIEMHMLERPWHRRLRVGKAG